MEELNDKAIRLIGIKKYKKNPSWAVAMMLALAFLLTGCDAASGVTDGLDSVTVLEVADNHEVGQDEFGAQANTDMEDSVMVYGEQDEGSDIARRTQSEWRSSSANGTFTTKGDFNGDSLTDYVSIESSIDGAVLTVNFGDGAVLTKSIDGSDLLWMSPITLLAGDFDGDGKDEMVFAPTIYGSNYGGRSLYIFRTGEDGGLTTMPLNCVKNTAIEYKQPESLDEDYMCIGTMVIDTDHGQLLRVRRLISPQENTAWYIDVRWNGEGWQIENISIGSAYGDEPVYQYTGNLFVAGRQQKCNIIVRKEQEANGGYIMDLTFIDSNSGETLQQLQYNKYRDDFMPDTIQDGSRILDVNDDGNDDIMVDLGVYGWAQFYICFVYDSSRNEFLQVPGFEDHPFPDVLKDEGIVLFHEKSDAATYWVDKYRVEGNQLRMLGCLTQIWGQSGVRYTEEAMVDGVLVKIKENVTADEIDHFDAWHMWT